MTGKNGTIVYQRQHKRGLTLPQLNAVDLLASGKTDKETAELLNLSLRTVETQISIGLRRVVEGLMNRGLDVREFKIKDLGK